MKHVMIRSRFIPATEPGLVDGTYEDGQVWIDGVLATNVISATAKLSVGDAPRVVLEFIPESLDLDVDAVDQFDPTSEFEDCDWDAVNEMVSSGWKREDAISEVAESLKETTHDRQ